MIRVRMLWWYIIFFVIALKIPTVWLCWVVWWAIKAKPDHETGGSNGGFGRPKPGDGGPRWWRPDDRATARAERLARRSGPHGPPSRRSGPTRLNPARAERPEVEERKA